MPLTSNSLPSDPQSTAPGQASSLFPAATNTATPTPPGALNIGTSIPSAAAMSSSVVSLDIFDSLLVEASINGTSFPCSTFTENGSQRLVHHMYPNVNTARLEPTGRNSSNFSISAVLTNNIYPSENETWKPGNLFPTVFQTLLSYCYSNDKPVQLVHPFLGLKYCYIASFNYSFVGAGPRDGVLLKMDLIETIHDTKVLTTSTFYVGEMVSNANALDMQLGQTVIQNMSPPGLSFGQFMSSIAGQIANIVNVPNQAVLALNQQILQLNGVGVQFSKIIPNATSALANNLASLNNSFSALVQTANTIAVQNQNLLLNMPVSNAYVYNKTQAIGPTVVIPYPIVQMNQLYNATWTLNYTNANNATQFVDNCISFNGSMIAYYQALNRIETAVLVEGLLNFQFQLNQVQTVIQSQTNNQNNNTVLQYIVQRPTTMIYLSNLLNQSVDDLLALNSTLADGQYIVPETSVISYYQA